MTIAAERSLEDLLAESAALHDHLCPRQVLGIRMGMYAAKLLHLALPQDRHDKRLLTIVETDGCFADGISVATGCWLGHRTLRCVDHGKIAATMIDTNASNAVRLHPARSARKRAPTYAPDASSRWHAYLIGYQHMPDAELFDAKPVRLAVPVETVVSSPDRRAVCECCGEEVFNGREVVMDGRTICLACAGDIYLLPTPQDDSP
ncbi:MAG: FmdE family protein [Thermomicrobiales bacterium]